MPFHHSLSKIYLHLTNPPNHSQATPCYILLLPALFQKVTGLSQFVPPRSSGKELLLGYYPEIE